MANLTNDQYWGLSKLQKWYSKYQNQFIEVSGTIGTGTWDLVQEFLEHINLDDKEVMYLSYDQKQVLELAFKKYHAYYINSIIYNYVRIVDFDTIPVLNRRSKEIKYEWKREVRKKIDPRYKLIIVFDSLLLNYETINDLGSFGVPVILIRDPMLLPAPDTYTFLRDANINLYEINEEYIKSPIVYFAHKVLQGQPLVSGNYDNVSIVRRKDMNLYNIRSSDMVITITENTRNLINNLYRQRIMKRKDLINVAGEKVIVAKSVYDRKLVNSDEKNVKVHFTKGLTGYLSRVNKHSPGTKYVGVEFRPEFYHETFTGMMMDRHHLNKLDIPSQQIIPDEICQFDYAYALTVPNTRSSHWDKVTLVNELNEFEDVELQRTLMYQAISRSRKSLTIVL